MEFVTRSRWGARQPKGVNRIYVSRGVFVHHLASGSKPEDVQLRSAQNYHMDVKKWLDLAYSWGVGQSGRIYEGRGWGVAGGHTEGHNTTSHAVAFIGNSDNDVPTPAALQSINEVIAEHDRRFGKGFVRPHQAVSATACPGGFLTRWIAAGRPLDNPPTPTPTPPPPLEPPDMPLTPADLAAISDLFDGKLNYHLAPAGDNPRIRAICEDTFNAANVAVSKLDILLNAPSPSGLAALTDADLASIANAVVNEQHRRLSPT